MRGGNVIFVIVVLIAGCSMQSREDKRLVDRKIKALEEMAQQYEKVKDKASYQEVGPILKDLVEQVDQLNKELDDLPSGRKEAALKASSAELEKAKNHMENARGKARNLAFGLPEKN